MAGYKCPLCQETMDRDLARFLDHTNQHVIDKIKSRHPEWQASDGTCQPCLEYYQGQLAGDAASINIGAAEQAKRYLLGVSMVILGMIMLGVFYSNGVPRVFRIALFPATFFAFFGFLQARRKICALYSEMGVRNIGNGTEKITDPKLVSALKRRGRMIIFHSFIGGLFLTVLFLLIP